MKPRLPMSAFVYATVLRDAVAYNSSKIRRTSSLEDEPFNSSVHAEQKDVSVRTSSLEPVYAG